MVSKVEISHKTIIFTVVFLLSLWVLFQVRETILWIFVSFILMAALKPSTDSLEKAGMLRIIAAILHYLLIVFFIVFAVSSVIPPLVSQTVHLAESLPTYLHTLLPAIVIDAQVITQQLTPISSNLLSVTIGIFSNLIAVFTVFVISFYLLMERKNLHQQLAVFVGEKASMRLTAVITKIEERLGAWVRGQLTLAFIIGLATFVVLSFLGLPFVLPLSIIAGVLEIVPVIGPIISAIPAIIIALTISPVLAIATTLFYFLIQQIEANAIVPYVMKRAVGLPPLVTILAIMIGAKLAGITGALLAIPIFVVIQTVLEEYFGGLWSTEAHKPDSVSR